MVYIAQLRRLLAPGLVLPLALWLGCKEQLVAKIPGLSNKTDVPVNVVLHVRYEGDNWIAKKYVDNKANFQLFECLAQTTESTEKTETETKSDKKVGEGTEVKKTQTGSDSEGAKKAALPGYFAKRGWDYQSEKDGALRRVTDIYFIPHSKNGDAPLEPGKRYCFDVMDVMTEGRKEVALGKSITFQTDKEDDFSFNSEPEVTSSSIQKVNSVSPSDSILFEFNDPVNPVDLARSTYLCKHDTGRDTANSNCGPDGILADRQIHLLEDLTADPDTGYITAQFNLYAVSGAPTFQGKKDQEDQGEYTLKIGIGYDDQGSSQRHAAADLTFSCVQDQSETPLAVSARALEQASEPQKNLENLTRILISSTK